MTQRFFHLSEADRREALDQAQNDSGRPFNLLEKDVWVVWSLARLYGAPFGTDLVFKGGTSLSKAHRLITRFSEDVDLTYSIRAIAPDLTTRAASDYPPSRSQEKKWTTTIHQRLTEWVAEAAAPVVRSGIRGIAAAFTVEVDGHRLLVHYEPLRARGSYMRPVVQLEFGARSTGDPHEAVRVTCDAAAFLPDIAFPTATAEVMLPERTFWEKATLIHVFCLRGSARGGDRFARHWHDVTRLSRSGVLERALLLRSVADDVVRHKSLFFAEKDRHGAVIDYARAVGGALQLVPTDRDCLDALRGDYTTMLTEGFLAEDSETFDELMDECRSIQDEVNAAAPADAA